jgi:putative transposase
VKGVTLDFSRPGKPTDNAFIEAFNGRFRAECLNAHWFLTLADAREKLEDWRKYYNEGRPHGASAIAPCAFQSCKTTFSKELCTRRPSLL